MFEAGNLFDKYDEETKTEVVEKEVCCLCEKTLKEDEDEVCTKCQKDDDGFDLDGSDF